MRAYLFAKRNIKEILREPINLFFGLGFPLILLGLLSVINANIPPEADNPMFAINNLAPGIAMFGTTFMALFGGMLLAKDRTSSFLMRLFTSPMRSADFLLGYTLPMIIMAAAQAAVTLSASILCGLTVSIGIIAAIFITTVTALLFIGLGMLCGSLFNDKAVGGICGALLTNLAGWLSGVFIPIDLIGGAFRIVAHVLPFYHSIEAVKAALQTDFVEFLPHIGIVLAYTLVIYIIAVFAFRRKMRGDKV